MATTGSGYIYKSLPNRLRIKNKAQILGQLEGQNFLYVLGDTNSVVGARNMEESEVYSNETPDKDLAVTDINTNDYEVTFDFRQMTSVLKQILWQSEAEVVAQAAVVGASITVIGVTSGAIVEVGKVNISNVEIVEAGPDGITLVENEHYRVDAEFGRIHFHDVPANATDFAIGYDAAKSETTTYGISSKTEVRAKIVIRQNNRWGDTFDTVFWIMQLTVDGDYNFSQDGDDFGSVTVKGRAIADQTKPAKYRVGQVREVPRLAA